LEFNILYIIVFPFFIDKRVNYPECSKTFPDIVGSARLKNQAVTVTLN